MTTSTPIVDIAGLSHNYGQRAALKNITFSVSRGEIFGVLGPNGCGKTTLFRVLSTLIRPQSGSVRICDFDLPKQSHEVRRRIGVVFQAPSLDRKLTAYENLEQQGCLYGLSGGELRERIHTLLERFELTDRAHEYVERFSGGMRRRVEIAKGLLHQPQLLILDEPANGLDPGARRDLWRHLEALRQDGVTSLLTTHYLDDAGRCDRLALLDAGERVALDTPDHLRALVGGDVVTIRTRDIEFAQSEVEKRLNLKASVVDNSLRIETAHGYELVARLAEVLAGRMEAITVSKPTLEDVFIHKTGRRLWKQREIGNGDSQERS